MISDTSVILIMPTGQTLIKPFHAASSGVLLSSRANRDMMVEQSHAKRTAGAAHVLSDWLTYQSGFYDLAGHAVG